MDTITHGLLGATIGQAFFKKRLGPKATWIGAAAAMIPDLDVLVGSGAAQMFTFHRSYTHALPVEAVAAGFFALVITGIQRGRPIQGTYLTWFLLFLTTLFSHALLDWTTSYGVMLMLPFTWHRYAVNCVGVLDVFFTGSLVLFLLLGKFITPLLSQGLWWQRALAQSSLGLFILGLGLTYGINEEAKHAAKHNLQQRGYANHTVESYPTLFQPILRQLVAQKDQHFLTAYRTWWEKDIAWSETQGVSGPDIDDLKNTPIGQKFLWFTAGKIKGEITRLPDGTQKVRLTDMRYLDPLDKTTGMWGIEALYQNGQRIGDVRFAQRRRSFRDMNFKESWALIRYGFQLFWNRTFYGAPL